MSAPEIRRVVFHVDLDAFYASVEQRDNPSLAGKPIIVGAAPGHRGVVSACSYEARRFGIRSAMPISQAYRRCPQGVYLPVRMERYIEVSRQVMGILEGYTPHLQQISVDEAFLDLTGTERLFGPAADTGRRLKAEVMEKTGLVISVGIAPNKYLAKLATNSGKPNGLVEVTKESAEAFLDGLALGDLWGIGEKTLQRLTELNITSVKQLRGFAEGELSRMLGAGAASFLASATRGGDPGIFSEEPRSRSLSSERTFERDRKDRTGIERALLELCHEVVFRMIEEGWKSKTVSLKLRFHDFTTVSAQKTLKHWVSSGDELDAIARELLNSRWNGTTPVRLVGIGFSSLTPVDSQDQLELFTDEFTRKKRVEEAVFKIRRKLGDVPLTRASLIDSETRRRPGRPPTGTSGGPSRSEDP
ncbi:MAG TPA: DNA polymerase IV [Spirochaetia bacterium]|nr:DNA polymerase IV [Spirochaetia bacterium]